MKNEIYKKYNILDSTIDFVNNIESKLAPYFKQLDEIEEFNQLKVLNAFHENKLSEAHFFEATGYGYTDTGRDVIEKIFADIFNAEDALVRQQIVSGTHAIATVLFALTKAGDKILSINGLPYDTILSIIGTKNEKMSLKYYGVDFDKVDLLDGNFDYENIKNKIDDKTKIIMIQRSRGYDTRKSFSIQEISDVIKFIKSINKDLIVFVDNCYGEFVDMLEPTDVAADIIAGSLIKNIGGGLAKSGGYIVGKKDLIELCSYRLTTPGLGKEVGISFNQNRTVLQGLYFAPMVVKNALKGAKLFSKVYNELGFKTYPDSNEPQNDIVLAIEHGSKEALESFCKNIQSVSTVDSFASPEFADMPGYDDKVIMAAGNFIQGSSIELSADGPLRAPYISYLQGGLSYYQVKLAVMKCINNHFKEK